MTYYLPKTEPNTYSVVDLEREGHTVWDGVKNPLALRAIGEMRPGDRVLIYHSGGVSAIVGLAKVASAPRPDPKNHKLTVVELEFVKHLDPPTNLQEINASGQFNDWTLVRQSRLSTMAVPEKFVAWLRKKYD